MATLILLIVTALHGAGGMTAEARPSDLAAAFDAIAQLQRSDLTEANIRNIFAVEWNIDEPHGDGHRWSTGRSSGTIVSLFDAPDTTAVEVSTGACTGYREFEKMLTDRGWQLASRMYHPDVGARWKKGSARIDFNHDDSCLRSPTLVISHRMNVR